MNEFDPFAEQMNALTNKISALHMLQGASSAGQDGFSDAFEQLSVALQELQAAQDELRQQNDELVAANQMVALERQRYQDLFELSPDAYLATDPRGKIIEANRAAVRLFGVPPFHLVGKPLIVFVAMSDRAMFRRALVGLSRQPAFSRREWECLMTPRTGTPFPAVITAAIGYDSAGEGMLRLLVHDVTRQRLVEQRLVESKRMLQTLFDASLVAIIVLDRQHCVIMWNHAAETILGWTEQEVLGQPNPISQPATLPGVPDGVQGDSLIALDTECLHKQGHPVPVTLSTAVLGEEDGQVRGYVLLLVDISDRKRAEAELTEARNRLAESREAERLRLAHDLHDGAVQDLLGISYQLAEVSQQAARSAEPSPLLVGRLTALQEEIVNVSQSLRNVISDLRPPGLIEFGLSAALQGYLAQVMREGGPHQPTVLMDLDPTDHDFPAPVALCLFRVAQEAVRNAQRHAQASTVVVTLTVLPDEVLLEVSDDGLGFQVPSSKMELIEDNHFGLPGMAERVEALGGDLAIRSSPERGTQLRARIPLAQPNRGQPLQGSRR